MGESPTLPGGYMLYCQVCIRHFPLGLLLFLLFYSLSSTAGWVVVELDLWGTVNVG